MGGGCGGSGAGKVQTGDAAVEPEAGDKGKVVGAAGGEVKQDADVVAAGLVDQIVKVVEGSQGWIDRLGLGRVGLDGSEEDGVDTQGMEVVEMLRDAAEGAAFGGAEVGGVNVVDDGVLPPRVRIHAGSGPARTGEGLCQCGGGKGAGEEEGEESAGSFGHTVVLEMLPENLAWRNL